MSELRNRRRQLGLSLKELSQVCGISASYLSRCESGERPGSPEVREKLRKALGLSVEEPMPELPAPVLRRMRTRIPWIPHPRRLESWARVSLCHPGLQRRLGNPVLPGWFREQADCDASSENLSLLSLLAAGGVTTRANPGSLGFSLPVLDGHKRSLGPRKVPCIYLKFERLEILYFPQISIRTANRDCRVDGLVLCRWGRRKLWAVVEIDGPGHAAAKDPDRTAALDIPVIRIPEQTVFSLHFVQELCRSLKGLLACPVVPPRSR